MARDPAREVDAWTDAFAKLHPTGKVWARDPGLPLGEYLRGQASIWALSVSVKARLLLDVEAFPDTTTAMLPEWERAVGLPEDCYATAEQTIEGRRALLLRKLTTQGGQSRAYFIGLASDLGYPEARITEWTPFRCGYSGVGNPRWRTGSPLQRNVWRMHVGMSDVTYFRCGRGRVGRDPQARLRRAEALECLVRKWKPAHTDVIFTYTIAAPLYPTDVTWFRCGAGHVGRDPQARINTYGVYERPPPIQAAWFRCGKSRVGADPHARIARVVTH